LWDYLTNYKRIAHDQHAAPEGCSSSPCGHCALCGKYGKHHSIVEKEDYLCTPTGRIKLTQRLSYANYGIYVATCLLCKEQYVGQTKNKFSVRWTAHRNNWDKSTGKEEGALIKHYTMKYLAISENLPLLPNCYMVTFVEQPPCENLDWCEDKWMHRIKALINLDRMIFPDIR